MYYGARYYDPWVGRFLSQDPDLVGPAGGASFAMIAANPGNFNAYTYALNAPTVYTDPTGRVGCVRMSCATITPHLGTKTAVTLTTAVTATGADGNKTTTTTTSTSTVYGRVTGSSSISLTIFNQTGANGNTLSLFQSDGTRLASWGYGAAILAALRAGGRFIGAAAAGVGLRFAPAVVPALYLKGLTPAQFMRLWGRGAEGAQKVLGALRGGEFTRPDGVGARQLRSALEWYRRGLIDKPSSISPGNANYLRREFIREFQNQGL